MDASRFATFDVVLAGQCRRIGRLSLAQLQRIESAVAELSALDSIETVEAFERKQALVPEVLQIATGLDVLDIPGVTNAEVAVAFKTVLAEAGFKAREGSEVTEASEKVEPAKFWRKLYGRLIAAGIAPSAIDAMTLWDVEALYEHWGEAPPANEILAAVHLEKPKAKGQTDAERAIMEKYRPSTSKAVEGEDDPSGIGSLIAAFPAGGQISSTRLNEIF